MKSWYDGVHVYIYNYVVLLCGKANVGWTSTSPKIITFLSQHRCPLVLTNRGALFYAKKCMFTNKYNYIISYGSTDTTLFQQHIQSIGEYIVG
jgi:hypothetical protein